MMLKDFVKGRNERVILSTIFVLFFAIGGILYRHWYVWNRTPEDSPPKTISWQEAAKYYGKYCTVEGTIVLTKNTGKVCFLNFHPNWRRYFTAVIFAEYFTDFPPNPEEYYLHKQVRITGIIKQYNGKPEIILESPAQIEVLERQRVEK